MHSLAAEKLGSTWRSQLHFDDAIDASFFSWPRMSLLKEGKDTSFHHKTFNTNLSKLQPTNQSCPDKKPATTPPLNQHFMFYLSDKAK